MRAAIYARVSTLEQEPENQLQELRRYTDARGWTIVEYVDKGVRQGPPACARLLVYRREARRPTGRRL